MNDAIRTATVRIPGQWRDLWLYRGQLLLWAQSGALFTVPVESLQATVRAESDKRLGLAFDYLIFRTDWKYSEPFTRLANIPAAREGIFACLDDPQSSTITVPVDQILTEVTTDQVPGYVLDCAVYGNRIFTCTESGLFETVLPSQNFRDGYNPQVQLLDFRVFNIDTLGSRLVTSAGDRGVFDREITFGLGSEWTTDSNTAPKQIDDYSRRVSFASYSVLNYKGLPAPSLIRTRTERRRMTEDASYEETVIDGYEAPAEITEQVAGALDGDEAAIDFRVVGNSNNQLLVRNSGRYRVVSLYTDPRTETRARVSNRYRRNSVSPELANTTLLTHRVRAGFLMEQFDAVGIITERGSYDLIQGSTQRVRTFPRSKFYHDAFATVSSSHVDLVGFLELA